MPDSMRYSDGHFAGLVVEAGREPGASKSTGEIAGSATAAQCPSVACKAVKFKARSDNVGSVYLGVAATVTTADAGTDATTGYELASGDETDWLPAANVNEFWRICDNAGDDLTYMTLG